MLKWRGGGISESWAGAWPQLPRAQQLVALIRVDFSIPGKSPLLGAGVNHPASYLEADGICSERPDGGLSQDNTLWSLVFTRVNQS